MPKFTIVMDTMGDKRYLNPFTRKYEDGKYFYLHPAGAISDFRMMYPFAVRKDSLYEYHPAEHHPTESDLWPAGQMFYIQRED
jgi:hypothetical protein